MSTIIDIIAPMFALIGIGWLLARLRVLGQEAAGGLSVFVFYVAIPALLFHKLAQGQSVGVADLTIVVAYFGPTLALFAASMLLLGPVLGLSRPERVVLGMGSGFSNNVQLGIPVVLAVYGERGLVLLMLIISIHSIVMIGLPTALMEVVRGKGEAAGSALANTARALTRNPVLVALVVGVVWGFFGWPIPALVDRITGILGQAMVPCSLVAMGASLAGYRLAGAMRDAAATAATKLLAHPALVWLLAGPILGLPPLQVAVATTAAALPIGVNVFILAQTYATYTARATSAILLSTAASVLTLGLLVIYFRATVAA